MNKNNTLKIVENVQKQYDFSFSNNTTYGLGGGAEVAYFPKSERQAIAVFNYLISQKINFVTLGNGSNILASDSGFKGSVLSTKYMAGVYRKSENTIYCRAGTKVSTLLKYCVNYGLGGLEYLAGIPASIGGLVYMNGGAGGKCIAQNIASVKLFDGKIRNFSNKSCNFGNKYSIMRDIISLILGVELIVVPQSGENVRRNIASYLENRSFQPKGKSCGCVFKNVDGKSAGKIIDDVGLKGLSIGGARVSETHANFIINCGASAADVYALIAEVKRRVLNDSGILLEEEVVYIGDF